MSKLSISPELELPAKVVTEKLGFLGRTGSGKSYAAMKLAEEMSAAGAQFVVLDPVGVWFGLRLAADRKSPGILLPVFGGLHGDVPLEPTTGALIADLIVDRGISCVIDVSQFESDADKARFAEAWASRFYFRKKSSPSAVHVFIEEAQEFVPQNSMRGEERMLHAFTRLQKLGRNFGIGTSLISQRPQEVNKKALNMTELLFAFQMTGPQERKTMKDWVSEKGIDEDIAAVLPKLGVGTAHVWSPAWLQISETVKIGKRWTFDASSTPKVGTAAVVKELAPIDLEQLRKSMAATIEKAKAEDPKLLRARIAELERAAKVKVAPPAPAKRSIVEDTAIAERARKQVKKEFGKRLARIESTVRNLAAQYHKHVDAIGVLFTETADAIDELRSDLPEQPLEILPNADTRTRMTTVRIGQVLNPPRRTASPKRPAESNGDGAIAPSKQRVLDAIAAFEQLGISPVKRVNAAFFAGYTENGHFNNMLGELRIDGFLDYPQGGMVALTDTGRAIANPDAHPIRSLDDLLQTWLGKLSPSEGKLLLAIAPLYPVMISRAALAEETGYTENGHFNNMLGHLRTLGVIDYPVGGHVSATDVLFPPGLA